GTTQAIEVRLQVWDRAGNRGEGSAFSSPGGGTYTSGSPAPANPNDPRVVNTRDVTLRCQLDDVGKWGISGIDVYKTTNGGQTWTKEKSEPVEGTPGPGQSCLVTVHMEQEDTYGFILNPRNKAGLGSPPPAPGAQPNIWLRLDLTKPEVNIQN